MKTFYTQHGIGHAKYVVNFHDGESTHEDGSKFFDIAIFKNKKVLQLFVDGLLSNNYTPSLNLS